MSMKATEQIPLIDIDKFVLRLYYDRAFTPEDMEFLAELENSELQMPEWGIFLHPVLGVKCFCDFPSGAKILLAMRYLPERQAVVFPLYGVDKKYLKQILTTADKPGVAWLFGEWTPPIEKPQRKKSAPGGTMAHSEA